jgi:hypothetical protein
MKLFWLRMAAFVVFYSNTTAPVQPPGRISRIRIYLQERNLAHSYGGIKFNKL